MLYIAETASSELASGRPAAPAPQRAAGLVQQRICLECGSGLSAGAPPEAEFCCVPCRSVWRDRRAARGAQLYDLFMALRYERRAAKLAGVWTIMCALASAFRDADRTARGGRRSWRMIDAALGSLPQAYGRGGDRR